MKLCPRCGFDVAGFVESTGEDGMQRFTQAVKTSLNNDGTTKFSGGFTHVVGGQRCRVDPDYVVADQTSGASPTGTLFG